MYLTNKYDANIYTFIHLIIMYKNVAILTKKKGRHTKQVNLLKSSNFGKLKKVQDPI